MGYQAYVRDPNSNDATLTTVTQDVMKVTTDGNLAYIDINKVNTSVIDNKTVVSVTYTVYANSNYIMSNCQVGTYYGSELKVSDTVDMSKAATANGYQSTMKFTIDNTTASGKVSMKFTSASYQGNDMTQYLGTVSGTIQ